MDGAKETWKSIREGEDSRRQYLDVWAECDNYFAGKQTLYRHPVDGRIINVVDIPRRRRNIRDVYNVVTQRCMAEVSAYTARFPDFQVDPAPPVWSQSASVASQSAAAAALAGERQLAHFKDELRLVDQDEDVVQMAVVLGEGYMFPYFDSSAGRALGDSGKYEGRVKNKVLGPDRVVWEGGVHYEDSKWFAYDCFYTKAEFDQRYPGHPDIKPDYVRQDSLQNSVLQERKQGSANMIRVYEYYRRPTPGDAGVWRTMSGDTILDEKPYPYAFPEVADEQWMVRFSYLQPKQQSRAMSMMMMLLDPQRGFNRDKNLASEWKALTFIPMIEVPQSINDQQGFDKVEPGKKIITNPALGETIRFVQPGNVPPELMNADDRNRTSMDDITGRPNLNNLPGSAAADTVQQIIQQGQAAQGAIARGMDSSRASVGKRLLLLARENYHETRDVRYTSYTGPQTQPTVFAKESPGWLNVRVSSGAPRSKAETAALAADWGTKGWTPPPKAMLAIEGNDLSIVTESFKLDIDKQKRENGDLFAIPPATAEQILAGASQVAAQVAMESGQFDLSQASPPPGPYPHASKDDNHDIHIDVLTNWFKTNEFALLPDAVKQLAYWHRDEHTMLKAQAAQREQMLQAAQAEQLGAANAARPPQQKMMPSQAKLPSSEDVASQAQTA